MGAEIGTAILLGAGMSMIGNIAGSAISGSQASAVNEDTMDFNHNEAQLARQWQEKMYNQQVSDQRQNYQLYQSPEAIAKMLGKIGVNPAKIFSSGASGLGSIGSVPSVPSGTQANVSGLLNPGESYAQGLQNVTKDAISMLNGLTDKNLKDAQTVKVLQEAANEKTLQSVYEAQAIASKYLPQKAAAEVNEKIANVALMSITGKLQQAQTATEEVMKLVAEETKGLKAEEKLQLQISTMSLARRLQNEVDLQEAEIGVKRSQKAYNYASAAEANENAKTIKEIRPHVVMYQRALANIHDTKDFVTSNTAWNEVQQSLYELQAAKLVPDQVMQAIEHAKKQNNWYEINELLGIVDTGVKAYGTYYGAKTGQGFVNSQNVRNRIDKDFKDWQMQHGERKKVYNVETGD